MLLRGIFYEKRFFFLIPCVVFNNLMGAETNKINKLLMCF